MNDSYKKIDWHSPNKIPKILILCDDFIKHEPMFLDLSVKSRKIKLSFAFIT